MNIISDRDILSSACAAAVYAISSKSTISALDGFLLDANRETGELTICGFDLEKGIKVTVSGDGLKIKEGGKIIINAVKLTSILRSIPQGSVSISTDDRMLATINSSRSEFTLHALPAENFPQIPELSGDTSFKIKNKALKQMISSVLFSVAQNNARPSFNGAFFEIDGANINMVGSDGFRVAIRRGFGAVESDSPLTLRFIVPGKSLGELLKLLSGDEDEVCEMELTRKHLIIKFDNIIFFSRLIESEYMDYRKNIRNEANSVAIINTREFADSIERASLLIEDKQKSFVRLEFKAGEPCGSLCVTSDTTLGKVFDECDVQLSGNEIKIHFNHRFLSDVLKNIHDEKILLRMESPLKSLIIFPFAEDGAEQNAELTEFLYLVLPLNIR